MKKETEGSRFWPNNIKKQHKDPHSPVVMHNIWSTSLNYSFANLQ